MLYSGPLAAYGIATAVRGDRTSGKNGSAVKVYDGTRNFTDHSVIVTVGVLGPDDVVRQRKPLPLRLDLYPHSPAGFEWGYGGSGPSQLALALCADALGDGERALRVYQHFKWQHVLRFPQAGWRLTDEQIKIDVLMLEESAARSS